MTGVKLERALDSNSIDWGEAFPDHCYICHVTNADDVTDDTSKCGPHCEPPA